MVATNMINVQEAVRLALEYCAPLFGEVERLRLEEVELSEDEKHWLITIGFDDPALSATKKVPSTWSVLGLEPRETRIDERQYKVVNLDAQTGNVRSVKIRRPLERVSWSPDRTVQESGTSDRFQFVDFVLGRRI